MLFTDFVNVFPEEVICMRINIYVLFYRSSICTRMAYDIRRVKYNEKKSIFGTGVNNETKMCRFLFLFELAMFYFQYPLFSISFNNLPEPERICAHLFIQSK